MNGNKYGMECEMLEIYSLLTFIPSYQINRFMRRKESFKLSLNSSDESSRCVTKISGSLQKNIKGKACGHKSKKKEVSLTPEKHFINYCTLSDLTDLTTEVLYKYSPFMVGV